MAKLTILMGSPRKNGNTAALLGPFLDELARQGAVWELFWLYDMDIHGCVACRSCQNDWPQYNCAFQDDLRAVYDAILAADAVVLATPIYGWYCTGPMKNALDRLIYCMCKYYGDEKGPALWRGKTLYLLTTCGYPVEKGTDLFEAGMRRYCRHGALEYGGMYAAHDPGYNAVFMSEDKAARAAAFARQIAAHLAQKETPDARA